MERRIPLTPVQFRELYGAITQVENLRRDLAGAEETVRVISALLAEQLDLPSTDEVRLDRLTRELIVPGVSRSAPAEPDLFQE